LESVEPTRSQSSWVASSKRMGAGSPVRSRSRISSMNCWQR